MKMLNTNVNFVGANKCLVSKVESWSVGVEHGVFPGGYQGKY